MRDETFEISRLDACLLARLAAHGREVRDNPAVHRLAFLAYKRIAVLYPDLVRVLPGTAHCYGAYPAGADDGISGAGHHCGARAVTKKYTRRSIGPVSPLR